MLLLKASSSCLRWHASPQRYGPHLLSMNFVPRVRQNWIKSVLNRSDGLVREIQFKQFMLIGGDAGMGHFFYKVWPLPFVCVHFVTDGLNSPCAHPCHVGSTQHPSPVTEEQKWSAYPGCYALSKVLEECMLEQYYIQYGLNVSAQLNSHWNSCLGSEKSK